MHFCAFEKVEKTSWFWDLFIFNRHCIYSSCNKGCKVLNQECGRGTVCQRKVFERGTFSVVGPWNRAFLYKTLLSTPTGMELHHIPIFYGNHLVKKVSFLAQIKFPSHSDILLYSVTFLIWLQSNIPPGETMTCHKRPPIQNAKIFPVKILL